MWELHWISCFSKLRAKFTQFVYLTLGILRNNLIFAAGMELLNIVID